jgi:hypothetical protein
MEGFWLTELFAILSTNLVCVNIWLSGPTGRIPESAIHHVSWTIVVKCHPWTIQVSFVCYFFLNVCCDLLRKFLGRITTSEYLFGTLNWIDIAWSEGSLIWRIVRMICRMSKRISFCPKTSRGWVQGIICFRNVDRIKTSGRHVSFTLIQMFLMEYIPTLFSQCLPIKGISTYLWSISLVFWNHCTFIFNRLTLNICNWWKLYLLYLSYRYKMFGTCFDLTMRIRLVHLLRCYVYMCCFQIYFSFILKMNLWSLVLFMTFFLQFSEKL